VCCRTRESLASLEQAATILHRLTPPSLLSRQISASRAWLHTNLAEQTAIVTENVRVVQHIFAV
jgi:hypothetical protein